VEFDVRLLLFWNVFAFSLTCFLQSIRLDYFLVHDAAIIAAYIRQGGNFIDFLLHHLRQPGGSAQVDFFLSALQQNNEIQDWHHGLGKFYSTAPNAWYDLPRYM